MYVIICTNVTSISNQIINLVFKFVIRRILKFKLLFSFTLYGKYIFIFILQIGIISLSYTYRHHVYLFYQCGRKRSKTTIFFFDSNRDND